MSKLIRLSKTGIEYGNYAWNFASGCGNNVDGKCRSGGFKCWAYPITQRFVDRYPNGFKPTIYPEALLSPLYLKKPSRILCAFMGDLFWDCPEFDPWREIVLRGEDGRVFFEGSLRDRIMMTIDQCPQHTFLFLTKQPQNLIKFSPYPPNSWVGVTATNWLSFSDALGHLATIEAKVKYLSLEPLLGEIKLDMLQQMLFPQVVDQVIIGSCTGTRKDMEELIKRYPDLTLMPWDGKWTLQPKMKWIDEIVAACDKVGIPVFLKNNLMPLMELVFGRENYLSPILTPDGDLRQEMPTTNV